MLRRKFDRVVVQDILINKSQRQQGQALDYQAGRGTKTPTKPSKTLKQKKKKKKKKKKTTLGWVVDGEKTPR
jgi:hypothetical protein